jgi:hypothetical protein
MMAGKIDKARQNALPLISSLRNDWDRIVAAEPEEHADVHAHMRWCLEELIGLVRELEADDA